MKNQYVGDYNDLVKYAILRRVLAEQLRLAVGWMLTQDDQTGQGGRIDYLSKRSTYRDFDPPLFDCLHNIVSAGSRNVAAIERSGIVPAEFF